MSRTINLQHIVFRTRWSQSTIPLGDTKKLMLKYIYRLCQSLGCYLVQINAHLNHVHILIDIPADTTISEVVGRLKSNSSRVFHHHAAMPLFEKWAKRYASFSVSYGDRERVRNYIANQEEHHRTEAFHDEMKRLFEENGLDDLESFFDDGE